MKEFQEPVIISSPADAPESFSSSSVASGRRCSNRFVWARSRTTAIFNLVRSLLRREPSIHGNKRVEFLFSQCKQFAILDSTPTAFLNRCDLMADEIARESAVNALVEQNLHFVAEASMHSFASSRNAMTCSRETLGKPSRKSSMESPPSR